MGIVDKLAGIDTGEFFESGKRAKTDLKKAGLNDIDVRYISSDFRNYIPTIGTIFRDTDISYVLIENPAPLGVLILDQSVLHNKLDGRESIDVIEGYPFSLAYTKDFHAHISDIKKAHPQIKTWTIPVSINNIPRGKYEIELPTLKQGETLIEKIELKKIEFTQKFIYQLSNVKLFDSFFKPKNDGIIVGAIVGGLVGVIVGFIARSYFG